MGMYTYLDLLTNYYVRLFLQSSGGLRGVGRGGASGGCADRRGARAQRRLRGAARRRQQRGGRRVDLDARHGGPAIRTWGICMMIMGDLYAESGQTLQGSFSAGWLAGWLVGRTIFKN